MGWNRVLTARRRRGFVQYVDPSLRAAVIAAHARLSKGSKGTLHRGRAGSPLADLARRYGISRGTVGRWVREYRENQGVAR